MRTNKRTKLLVLFVIAVFLLVTGGAVIMYLADPNAATPTDTMDTTTQTGDDTITIQTGSDTTTGSRE